MKPIIREDEKGLAVDLGRDKYVPLKIRQTGNLYWDLATQPVFRQAAPDLERILMHVFPNDAAKTAVFRLVVGGAVQTGKTLAYGGGMRVPKSEVETMNRALDALERKAASEDSDIANDAKMALRDFRLPDPTVNPELYRLWGTSLRRRLAIAWGCEYPSRTSLPARAAIALLKCEGTNRGWLRLAQRVGAVLLVLFLLLFGIGTWARHRLGPPISFTATPAYVAKSKVGEVVELRSRCKNVATGPMLLTFRGVTGEADLGLPSHRRLAFPAGIHHLTGPVRAGNYQFRAPSGENLLLPIRDFRGGGSELLRASMVLDRRRIKPGETIEVSLSPSFSSNKIAFYELGWGTRAAELKSPDSTVVGPFWKITFPDEGKYTVFGVVTDQNGLQDTVVEEVDVSDGRASPRGHVRPPAVALLGDAKSRTELAISDERSAVWIDGQPAVPSLREHGVQRFPIPGEKAAVVLNPAGGDSSRLSIVIAANAGSSFRDEDFIPGHGRLPAGRLCWYETLSSETQGGSMHIVAVLKPVLYADKSGMILRAESNSLELFGDLTWTCTSEDGRALQIKDEAEVLFMAVEGKYRIGVTARSLNGTPLSTETIVRCQTPPGQTHFERALGWFSRFSF